MKIVIKIIIIYLLYFFHLYGKTKFENTANYFGNMFEMALEKFSKVKFNFFKLK